MAFKKFGPQRSILLDQNIAVIKYLTALSGDANSIQFNVFADSIPAIRTEYVVADPPWYLEHIKAFLWVASKICHLGGRIALSLPPKGTRPTIAAELSQIFEYALKLGLDVKQIKEDCLTYETPPFESNALRAAGCNVKSVSWRRGTLCVFQRVANVKIERPRYSCPTAHWLEAELYGTRFRFRCRDRGQSRIGFDDPSLHSLVVGDILPSVSRRHPLREEADVWSAGNRVFRCDASHILHQIVGLLAKKTLPHKIPLSLEMPLTKQAARQVQRAAVQIEKVAATERFERRFIGRG